MLQVLNCLTTEHDLRFVALAGLVCLIGVGAAIRMFLHGRDSGGRTDLVWLILTGLVAGASVWSTHFIAMLGYDPGLKSGYDIAGTAASLMIAVVGYMGAFALLRMTSGWVAAVAAGLMMAVSTTGMHYTGMAAFQTEGVVMWDPVLIAASISLGAIIAPLGLLVLGRKTNWGRSMAATGLITLSICALHFTAMGAATVAPMAGLSSPALLIDRPVLAGIVAGITCILISAALLMAAFDRSIRNEAGGRLAEALGAMSDGLAYYDSQDRLLVWNTQYKQTIPEIADRLFKGATFESILRVGLDRGDYPEAVGRETEWLAERLAARRRGDSALEQQLADGRWLRVMDQRSADGGVVSTIVDVTHLKQTAEDLARARDAAEAANRAKSEFLANMSHEIRTPLNGILGMAEVLSDTPLNEDQQAMLRLVSSSGATLQQLLSDILDLARVESGRLSLTEAPFDLARAVHEAGQLYGAPARAKGLAFFIDVDAGAETWVSGDVVRVKQILTNLVSNAVKFTQSGFVRLTAERAADRDGRPIFRLTVEDTGVGFDSAVRQRLFSRFEQADGSITRRFGGSGLGLAICRQLADMMQGDLDCESEPGGGSAFILTLPLALAEPPEQAEPRTSEPALVERRLKVLLADDHPTNRKVIDLILTQAGVEIVMAENGVQALDLFDRDDFDLILMDMQMPVMDGLSATRAIRDMETALARPATPVIMLTANALPEHVEAARLAGADRHLSKPVSAQALIAAVREMTAAESAAVNAETGDASAAA